ncbi:MAG TPA: cysteine desulfurase [Bacteroidota bacterium]|nr:cysteine desulfurase [Bacteroidota bacterium]
MFDPKEIRKDFPIFERVINGKPMVYLDSTATTQKPKQMLKVVGEYYRNYNANIHRGIYAISEEATAAYEVAREKVAKFINASDPKSVVFTRGTTESINLVASSWGRANLKPGDEILLTVMEHHSNLVPWHLISKETGAVLKFIPLTQEGTLDLTDLSNLLTKRTKILSLTHASNVLGTINPVEDLTRKAHQVGAIVIIDGAQSVPHQPVDVQAIDCDFIAFSGHKMLGPTGIGVLYGRPEIFETMPPYHGGGEMIVEVFLDRSTYRGLPGRFEAGTPNISGAIGLGAAVDYLQALGMKNVRKHEQELAAYALDALKNLDDITIYGAAKERGGVISFNLPAAHPHDVAQILDQEGVAIRAGHHCAQPLMRWLDVAATVRASMYVYSTTDDIDHLVAALRKVKEVFAGVLN